MFIELFIGMKGGVWMFGFIVGCGVIGIVVVMIGWLVDEV